MSKPIFEITPQGITTRFQTIKDFVTYALDLRLMRFNAIVKQRIQAKYEEDQSVIFAHGSPKEIIDHVRTIIEESLYKVAQDLRPPNQQATQQHAPDPDA